MPDQGLILSAGYFSTGALVLALLTAWLRRDLRRAIALLLVTVGVGMGGLLLLVHYGGDIHSESLLGILREATLAILAIGAIRIAVMFAFEAALGKLGMPKILAEVLLALVLVIYGLYRMNAAGVNLASIITTSAVITGAIAFSLQATFNNLWGGIALQLDNTCRIGDWIRLEGGTGPGAAGHAVTGQVIGIRWRCVAVATNSGETVMIPNAQLMNNRVTVIARRGDERIPSRRSVEFSVAFGVPPSRIIAMIEAALRRTEIRNVATSPPITVLCAGFEESGVRFVARYWLTDLQHDEWTDSQLRLHVIAALARHDLEIPYPHRVLVTKEAIDATARRTRELDARQSVLDQIALFATLTEPERRVLASELTSCLYVRHDVISEQGEQAESLYVLAEGRVIVYRDDVEPDGRRGPRTKLATLDAPAYFGEMGLLTGQARTATVIADGDVLCYRLDKVGFDAILRARPELADALSRAVVERQMANDATLEAASAEARARQASGRAEEVLRLIRDFFGLTG